MHRYYSAEVHAFQPYNSSFQQHVGMPQFYQPSVGNVIPPPPPSILKMVLTRSKRKVVQDDEDDDVHIVTLSAPKRKTTAKKVTKKIMKKETEGETEVEKKHWKDADVEVMIALRGEMELEFLKNAKKQGTLKFSVVLNFSMCIAFFDLRRKTYFKLDQLGFVKALAFASRPRAPLSPRRGAIKVWMWEDLILAPRVHKAKALGGKWAIIFSPSFGCANSH